MITGAVFIDVKKAFDLVDHECLLLRLEHYEVRKSSLDWFRNYLTTRTQRVQFGNDMSSTRTIRFGVPQGSILGSLLFVLYINEPPQCLENCSIDTYADDTIIYFTHLCTSERSKVVQADLHRVVQCRNKRRRLILNQSKTSVAPWKLAEPLPNHPIFVYSYTERL